MMQVKPYKPQNNNSITKTSDREKKNYTLDVYNEAAGIKPKKNVLEPYSKLVPNAQTTLNQPAQTNAPGTVQPFKAQRATVNSVPSTMPGTPAYKVDTNDMTIQEQAAKDMKESGVTMPNLSAPKNKPSLSGGTTFGSDPSRLASPSAVGTTAASPKASETPASPGSGTLADYTPAFKAATARPQAVEPAGFSSYMDMVNNTRKMQGLAPVSGGTQTMSAETGETKPNVLDPYSEAYQNWLDEANEAYGGDFFGYDASGLYGHDLEMYNETRDRLNAAEISRDQYLAQQREAERQKNIDLQNAFIGTEMTKKYLPIYLKQAGMGGLGVSQSTLAQVQNDYDNLVSGINSETSATTRELLQRYLDEYKKSKAEMQSNISRIESEKKEEERLNLVSSAQNAIEDVVNQKWYDSANNKITSYAEYEKLFNMIEENKNKYGTDYLNLIDNLRKMIPEGYEDFKNLVAEKRIDLNNGNRTAMIDGYIQYADRYKDGTIMTTRGGYGVPSQTYIAYDGKWYAVND